MASARAIAARGRRVFLSAPEHAGTSSPLAAGVLGPTIDPSTGAAFFFACASREVYADFANSVHEETGIDVQLELGGVLRVALSQSEAQSLRSCETSDCHWLESQEVLDLEPRLAPTVGALFHFRDGIVANDRVHAALRVSVRQSHQIQWTSSPVDEVQADDAQATIRLSDGSRVAAPALVVAAGAWSAAIRGLPTPPPVAPLRGQMVALTGVGLSRAVYGAGGYLTPRRDGRILSGSTLEHVGFDPRTTPHELDRLDRVATRLLPGLTLSRCDSWAGLRPMSPDGLPVIDRDPGAASVIYATGHTRNGILMGPLTGQVISTLACHEIPAFDLSPFSLSRFSTNLPI